MYNKLGPIFTQPGEYLAWLDTRVQMDALSGTMSNTREIVMDHYLRDYIQRLDRTYTNIWAPHPRVPWNHFPEDYLLISRCPTYWENIHETYIIVKDSDDALLDQRLDPTTGERMWEYLSTIPDLTIAELELLILGKL
jgi:hypothetical protein